jgi:hypothetical protein
MVNSLRPHKLHVKPSALLLDTASDLYKSGRMTASLMLDQQGNPRTQVVAGTSVTAAYIDVSTDPWRQYVVGVYQTLASHGADLIGVEASINYAPLPCFNPAHQHPPLSGGNWQPLAWIDIS